MLIWDHRYSAVRHITSGSQSEQHSLLMTQSCPWYYPALRQLSFYFLVYGHFCLKLMLEDEKKKNLNSILTISLFLSQDF